MNKKLKQNYQQLAQSTGLRFDPEGGALYGRRGEFDLVVTAPNESYPYYLAVSVSARRMGEPLTKEECKQFKRDNKPVEGLAQNGNVITMSLKNTPNQYKLQENMNNAVQALVNFLRARGFQMSCQTCGKIRETNPCYVSGSYMVLCPDCFTSLQQDKTLNLAQKKQKSENLIGGIVGALLGTLLGVVCIVILGQMGYVAALSGAVMAVCTLKGYELLGGKLTTKGIIISIVLMLVMTFVGDRIDWALLISRELNKDFIDAFQDFPTYMRKNIIDSGVYWGNLLLLYGFLLLGAVPTIINVVKNQRNEGKIYRL